MDAMEKYFAFIEAITEAENNGKNDFICPICGGTAHFERARSNGHLHAKCDGCRTRIME